MQPSLVAHGALPHEASVTMSSREPRMEHPLMGSPCQVLSVSSQSQRDWMSQPVGPTVHSAVDSPFTPKGGGSRRMQISSLPHVSSPHSISPPGPTPPVASSSLPPDEHAPRVRVTTETRDQGTIRAVKVLREVGRMVPSYRNRPRILPAPCAIRVWKVPRKPTRGAYEKDWKSSTENNP